MCCVPASALLTTSERIFFLTFKGVGALRGIVEEVIC